jgi:hypothetical protein
MQHKIFGVVLSVPKLANQFFSPRTFCTQIGLNRKIYLGQFVKNTRHDRASLGGRGISLTNLEPIPVLLRKT